MDDLKSIIAKNITELRTKNNLTQLQLAEKLNYSDKSISKWERAESLPDVVMLDNIAKLFNVNITYLFEENHEEVPKLKLDNKKRLYSCITGISIILVYFIAMATFIILNIVGLKNIWLVFIYALPVSSIVWLVLNSIWLNKRFNYFIVSCLAWTLILTLYLTLLCYNINIWLLFTLGLPSQLIICLWAHFKK